MSALYAGIDVGGSSIKTLVIDEAGTVVDRAAEPTAPATVPQLEAIAERLIDRLPGIAGIGILTPGTVDEDRGVVGFASNLDLAGYPIPERVSAATGRPARLGHDGRGAGLAESLFGAARGFSSSLVVPVGTGISAAVCLPGEVWAGATRTAGEIGHIPVFPDGEPCACGQRGCLDVYASGKGIATRYLAASGSEASAEEVARRLGSDPAADAVWATAVEGFALVFTQLTLAFDPAGIVLGGGLSRAGDALLPRVEARMREILAWREPPTLVTSLLGESAGQWGAAVHGCYAAGSDAYTGWRP